MKLNKIFAIALAALTMTACSDDDDHNFLGGVNTASGVTVEMGSANFDTQENISTFYVPIAVHGETNGKVTVTVEIREAVLGEDQEAAIEDVHYIITSKKINIAEGETTGLLEINNNWEQGVINNDRLFDITIVKVEGATIGAQSTCTVNIQNVDDAYTMMAGTWTLTCTDHTGTDQTWTIDMQTLPAGDEYYGTELDAFGFRGLNYIYLPFSFEYDVETEEITMTLMTGSFCTTSIINFKDLGQCIVAGSSAYPNGFGADIPCTADFNSITVDPVPFTLAVMPYPALDEILGGWGRYTNIKLTR